MMVGPERSLVRHSAGQVPSLRRHLHSLVHPHGVSVIKLFVLVTAGGLCYKTFFGRNLQIL
jgi:hypothetical protein